MPYEVIPIIDIPDFGDKAAVKVLLTAPPKSLSPDVLSRYVGAASEAWRPFRVFPDSGTPCCVNC